VAAEVTRRAVACRTVSTWLRSAVVAAAAAGARHPRACTRQCRPRTCILGWTHACGAGGGATTGPLPRTVPARCALASKACEHGRHGRHLGPRTDPWISRGTERAGRSPSSLFSALLRGLDTHQLVPLGGGSLGVHVATHGPRIVLGGARLRLVPSNIGHQHHALSVGGACAASTDLGLLSRCP
jgi:hypothetical protein